MSLTLDVIPGEGEITSRNLEYTSLARRELDSIDINLYSSMTNVKYHVHPFRVLGLLDSFRWELDYSTAKERLTK